MMAVRSRIPQGRSTKLGNVSKLPHSIYHSKASSRLPTQKLNQTATTNLNSGCATDNYKLAFVRSSDLPQATDINANNNSLNTDLSETSASINSDLQESSTDHKPITNSALSIDDNCEIISVCSLDPSPVKAFKDIPLIKGCQDTNENVNNLHQITVIQDPLLLEENSQVISSDNCNVDASDQVSYSSSDSVESGPSSLYNSSVDNSGINDLKTVIDSKASYSKHSTYSSKQTLNSKTRILPTTSTFVRKPNSGPGNKNWKKSQNSTILNQKKIQLPQKVTASNAMEYVKRITSQSDSSNNKQHIIGTDHSVALCNGNSSYSKPDYKITSTDQTSKNNRSNGKWSNDIDSAINRNRRFKSATQEERNPTSRSERKKIHQESKAPLQSSKNSFVEYLHGELSPNYHTLSEEILNGSQLAVELRKSGSRTPKIARPVVRPPRRRPPAADDIAIEDDKDNSKDVCNNFKVNQGKEFSQQNQSPTRRCSVPTSNIKATTRSRQRRRLSDTHSLQQLNETSNSELKEVNTESPTILESGDSLATELIRRKDRLQQNERYKDILENPDIITFGQWRIKQEGNYAPEEKYGVAEKKRIRSSADSDTISPVRSPLKLSVSEDFADDSSLKVLKGNESLKVHEEHREASDNKDVSIRNLDFSDEDSDLFDDLPSLNSTALMVDYSTCSNVSLQNNEEHGDLPRDQTSQISITETTFCIKDDHTTSEKNHKTVPMETNSTHSISEVSSDINKTNHPSFIRFPHVMDEVVTECRVMKQEMTRLHVFLNKEEEEKTKAESEMKKLRDKNALLTEEVNRLTRILEMKQSSPLKQATARHNLMTRDAVCQTDDNVAWYKTELRAVECELQQAVLQLKQVKEVKDQFDITVTEAEKKLALMLKGIQQI